MFSHHEISRLFLSSVRKSQDAPFSLNVEQLYFFSQNSAGLHAILSSYSHCTHNTMTGNYEGMELCPTAPPTACA